MEKAGPIVIIEDDQDDQSIFASCLENLHYENEIVFFDDGFKALEYLSQSEVKPFLIISDINMPKLNGFALRDIIHEDDALRLKCTPYIFFTTTRSEENVTDAYAKSIQGYFVKPNSFKEWENDLKMVIEYWKTCKAPPHKHKRT